jgi:hypothetical protein
MKTGKILDIHCQCGFLLFRYFKAGKGRIIKCFVDRLAADYVGLNGLPTFAKPQCPQCQKELGIIMLIHGEPALKINHGTIADIRL